jgi:mono/diheme cytochrome c family protein
MRGTRAPLIVASAAILLLVAIASGCSHGGSEGDSDLAAATRGRYLYQQNCSPCHDADNLQLLKQPPKLTGLFNRKTLPSGALATDAEVRTTIVDGRGIMPPFGQALDKQEVSDLLKYLHRQ